MLSIPYPSVSVSRWSGSISPNRIGWEGGEDGRFGGGEDGLLGALLRERCDMDLDVDGAPPASAAVFGLLILLANDAPLFCGRSAVVFARWEALGIEPELLGAWLRVLELGEGRGPVLEGWLGSEADGVDLALRAWAGRCMRDERAGGRGIMDDVSESNFFFRSLTLGLPAESALGRLTGSRPLLMGAEAERRLGRNSVRVLVVRGEREAWVELGGGSSREVGAVVAMGASFLVLANEAGSTPL